MLLEREIDPGKDKPKVPPVWDQPGGEPGFVLFVADVSTSEQAGATGLVN